MPTYVAPAERLLAPYAKRIGYTLEQLSGPGFELLVLAWLEDLVYSPLSEANSEPWIVESGLYATIRDGRIESEALA